MGKLVSLCTFILEGKKDGPDAYQKHELVLILPKNTLEHRSHRESVVFNMFSLE